MATFQIFYTTEGFISYTHSTLRNKPHTISSNMKNNTLTISKIIEIIRYTCQVSVTLYISVICITFLSCTKINNKESEANSVYSESIEEDSVFNYLKIQIMAEKSPDEAELILDSIEQKAVKNGYKLTPAYKIIMLRALIASCKLKPRTAVKYLNQIFHLPEIQKEPENYMFVTKLMSSQYFALNQNTEAIKYSLLCINKARYVNNHKYYARALISLQYIYFHSGYYDSKLTFLKEAEDIYINHPDLFSIDDYVWLREVEGHIRYKREEYNEAIRLYKEVLKIYKTATISDREGTKVEDTSDLNYITGQVNAILALLHIKTEKKREASQYYLISQLLFEQSKQSVDTKTFIILLNYLKEIGRFDEALIKAHEFEKITANTDSINSFNVYAKRQLSDIYKELGNYYDSCRACIDS